MMDDSKKRMNAISVDHTGQEDVQFTPPPPKKRFVNGGGGVGGIAGQTRPAVSGHSPLAPHAPKDESTVAALQDDVPEQDELQTFQKQAIWRQMQEYKRQYARALSQQEAHESSRDDALARAAVVEGVWKTLLEEIQTMLGVHNSVPDNIGIAADKSSEDDSDEDWGDDLESLRHALVRYAEKTRSIIAQVAHSSGGDPEKVQSRLDSLHRKATSLRARAMFSRKQVSELRSALQYAKQNLAIQEKQADRLQSSAVAQVFSTSITQPAKREDAPREDAPLGAQGVTDSETEKQVVERAAADAAAKANSDKLVALQSESAQLTRMLAAAQAQLEVSVATRNDMQTRLDHLQVEVTSLSDTSLTRSPIFQDLQRQVVFLKAELERSNAEVERLNKENDTLRQVRAEFFELSSVEHKAEVEHLRKEVETREADIARLRNSRDGLNSEIGVLKGRLAQDIKQIEAAHNLARANQDRIASLQSEMWRIRLAMAFRSSNQDLVADLMQKKPVLEKNKTSAEIRAELASNESLETQLANCRSALSELCAAKSKDVDVVLDSFNIQRELEAYRSRFGSMEADTDAEDTLQRKLVQAVKAKEEAEAQAKTNEAILQPLIQEIENLSTAWAALEGQMQSKVFNVAKKEDEIAALRASKTRADHKYFDECRTSSKLKEETVLLRKTTKKQDETVIKLNETLQQASQQIAAQEKECSVLRQSLENRQQKISAMTLEMSETKAKLERSDRRGQEFSRMLQERSEALHQEQMSLSAKSLEADRANKVLSELQSTRKAGNDTAREAALASQNEQLKKLLRCGACHLNFKSHTLLKCMHLFCKQCIDDRLSSRQRKCPQCGASFSAGDVSQIYL